MDARDWTLLVLASANGRPLSPVQLQKSLFLIGKKLPSEVGESFYEFSAYDYGPFCSAVYADAEELDREGLVSITGPMPRSYREYAATTEGLRVAAGLRSRLRPGIAGYLTRLVEWILPLSFDQLVRSVYRQFPEMKANSVFKE